ncbi:MAG: hypothetical protein QOF37_356, partial [Thermoleophilaceae bacterium]|nr:hypothetical protein [Thermoleophilaceae bacterium]
MSKRLLNVAIAVALVAVGFVAFALPASAEQRTLRVRLLNGSVITVKVDAPCVPMDQVPNLPGTPVEDLTPSSVCPPATTTPTPPQQPPAPPHQNPPGGNSGGNTNTNTTPNARPNRPSSSRGRKQNHARSHSHAAPNTNPQAQVQAKAKKRQQRHSNGVPTAQNPTFFDALPGPAANSVPNFVIDKFKVPMFLLPIYQAAGIQYGVRWEVLAAINE